MEWSRTGSVDALAKERLPEWLLPLVGFAENVRADDLTRFVPPHGEGRHSAVLVLFGPDRDLLVIRRASTMRSHAGQPALPGGAVDEGDADASAAALREAEEETGLDPSGVDVFGRLPDLWVPVTNFVVTPVLAWWRRPSAVSAVDPAEVSSVHRVPVDALVNPAHRCRVHHPSGFIGPGFTVDGLLIWGFTAGLIAGILDGAGWSVPWDSSRVVPFDGDLVEDIGS
jgi:8-oxo-dGTP pyrophosphatase MutT (NUDIX family)